MKYNSIIKKIKNDRGSLIVEATIVFPVTFLVIFILLFLGNVYFQRSRAQAIMTRGAVEAAARYSNPMAEYYVLNGSIPECNSSNNFEPYRYIFKSDMSDTLTEEIKSDVENMGSGLFSNMKANDVVVNVDYNNYGIYAMSQVSMTYSITMPIKMLGQTEPYKIDIEEYVEISAMEGSEMVRNVTMVLDIIEMMTGENVNFATYVEETGGALGTFFDFIN